MVPQEVRETDHRSQPGSKQYMLAAIFMKFLLTLIFVFLIDICFGQTQKDSLATYRLTIPYRPATLEIKSDTTLITKSEIKSNYGGIVFTDFKSGTYVIVIKEQDQRTITLESIIIKQGQKLNLNFKFEGPCLYDHPKDYIPTCPKKHSNNIIPIVYGLVATRGDNYTNKDVENVRYRGCVVTDCDPHFYCKEHDIEF